MSLVGRERRPLDRSRVPPEDGEEPACAREAGARSRLMAVMDSVNRRAGRGTLQLASAGTRNAWAMKRERMTPAYTTQWKELPVARA